jgi:hypothetical protein
LDAANLLGENRTARPTTRSTTLIQDCNNA